MNFGIDSKYIENIINICNKDKGIKSAYIFGSRAIGDYRDNSDIDLALDCNNELASTLLDLDECVGLYKLDILKLNECKNTKIYNEITKYMIKIYDREN